MSAEPVPTTPLDKSLPADPVLIRSQLPPEVAAVFDAEWESVLERAKRTQDLQSIHDLLIKWRFNAAAEQANPGDYFRIQELAERILAAGSAEAAGVKTYDARAVLEARLRRDADQAN